ncbi:MAG: hypothetical protein ABIU77_08830, partial [Ferruginibacter sp.]
MKSKVSLLLLTVVAFAACKKNSDVTAPMVTKIDTLSNSITTDMTLDANTSYVVNGQLYVSNNATLTIPAGVTVSFVKMDEKEKKGVLVITQGAKLIANGTADRPIVFTSAAQTKAPGDWGAIILLGKAPTNTGTGNVEGLPVSDNTRYGGTSA